MIVLYHVRMPQSNLLAHRTLRRQCGAGPRALDACGNYYEANFRHDFRFRSRKSIAIGSFFILWILLTGFGGPVLRLKKLWMGRKNKLFFWCKKIHCKVKLKWLKSEWDGSKKTYYRLGGMAGVAVGDGPSQRAHQQSWSNEAVR